MAEIACGEGRSRTAATIEILGAVSPWQGMATMGSVGLNATMGVVRARISLLQGEEAFVRQEVLLHRESVEIWLGLTKDLLAGKVEGNNIGWPDISPQIGMRAERFDYEPLWKGGPSVGYEMLVTVDSGVFDESRMICFSGPSVLLSPEGDALLKFAEDLFADTDKALKASWLTAPGGKA